jgi:tetratricopeptide (TPR) repeat protein
LRFAQVGKLFDDGQAARAKGDLKAMRDSFDQLLARDPNFEGRAEIAAGYAAFARQVLDKSRADAISALRRAERLDPTLKDVTSLRLTLEAEALEERGIADSTLLERALEQDPKNARAQAALQRFERGEPKRSEKARFVAAGSILGLASLFIAFILLRRPKPAAETPPAADPAGPTPAATEPLAASEAETSASSEPAHDPAEKSS